MARTSRAERHRRRESALVLVSEGKGFSDVVTAQMAQWGCSRSSAQRDCRWAHDQLQLGIDSSKISPSNPFEKSGSTAGMLQAAIAELDPAQAARWRVAAGGSLSVATMAELQSGEELSAAAQADLWNHDPEFVAEFQQQREKGLEAQLKALRVAVSQWFAGCCAITPSKSG